MDKMNNKKNRDTKRHKYVKFFWLKQNIDVKAKTFSLIRSIITVKIKSQTMN